MIWVTGFGGRHSGARLGYREAMKEPIGDSIYPPEAIDDVTVPPTDPVREAKQRDWGDVADVDVDPEDLRQGGPTKTPGTMTTTGGKAGSAMRHARGQSGKGKVAPTTTGDATSGGMRPPTGGSTDDASSSGALPDKAGKRKLRE